MTRTCDPPLLPNLNKPATMWALACILVFASTMLSTCSLQAQTFKTLYTFKAGTEMSLLEACCVMLPAAFTAQLPMAVCWISATERVAAWSSD